MPTSGYRQRGTTCMGVQHVSVITEAEGNTLGQREDAENSESVLRKTD